MAKAGFGICRLLGSSTTLLAAAFLPHAAASAAEPAPAPVAAPPPAAAPAAAPAEPKMTVPGPEGSYLRTLHTRIHFRFATGFIEGIAAKKPPNDPLNNASLRTEVYFGIRWDGSVADALVNQKSGVEAFDKAALNALRDEHTRYSPPPAELFGDDGIAHFRWVFARNHNL